MNRISNRIWGWAATNLVQQGRMGDLLKAPVATGPEETSRRLAFYAERWAYYENRFLYQRLAEARMRPRSMPVEWNPIPAVISFYISNTLGGDLEIQPGEDVYDEEALTGAIQAIWDWSNFTQLQRDIVETCSVFGDLFIKVAEKRRENDAAPSTAVYLQNLPPEQVVWWTYDERDFLTGIRIDTPRFESLFGTEKRRHTLVEVWRKDWGEGLGGVRRYETPDNRFVEDDRLGEPREDLSFTDLGYDFIPIVWGSTTMPWWYVIDQIDEVNAMGRLMRQLNRPVALIHGRHVDPDGRPIPAPKVKFDEIETSYRESEDGSFAYVSVPGQAQFDWAKSPIDMAAAASQQAQIRRGVETTLPEYRVAELDPSQIAATTLEMLLDQVGQRVSAVRDVVERALVRAQMMGLTIGQLRNFPGFSTSEIGLFENGDLDHSFVERGVFRPTPAMQSTIYKELRAAELPAKLAMKKAGFTEDEIAEYDEALAEEMVKEQTNLAAQFVAQQNRFDRGEASNGAF